MKTPWRRAWKCALVFFPGESHGQEPGRLYIVHGVAESDATEMN